MSLAVLADRVRYRNKPPLYRRDENFQSIYADCSRRTLVSEDRCFMLYQLVRSVCDVPGVVVEVGVYRGGTARLLARSVPHRECHAFDTFAGLPDDSSRDWHRAGDMADTSAQEVASFLSDLGSVEIHEGVFPASSGPIEGKPVAFAHLDVDQYQSTRDSLAWFWPRMSPGGIIVCDDYGFSTCPGARQAVDEFFGSEPEAVIWLPTGQAFMQKRRF